MEDLPAVVRLFDGSREVPSVENREEGRSRKDRSPNGKGVGGAVVDSSFALLDRSGQFVGESPEGVRARQMMQAAPMGPLVVQQSMGAPVVYGAQNGPPQGGIGHYFGPQGSNVVGLPQQSMCAGVPPHEMASQYVLVVASPGMVSEVMAMEEMNPWSDAKRVEAFMSSPLTNSCERIHLSHSATGSLKGSRSTEEEVGAIEKNNFCVARWLSSKSWITWEPRVKVVSNLTGPERLGEDTQSSGGSYETASPEQKNTELNPAQGQGVQFLMKVGEQLVDVPPPPPRVEQEHRPMDIYMNYGWMDGMPLEGVRNPNPRQPMRNQGLGGTENTRYFLFGDQQGHMGNPQAQGGGAPAGQGHQPGVGCGFPGGNTQMVIKGIRGKLRVHQEVIRKIEDKFHHNSKRCRLLLNLAFWEKFRLKRCGP